MARSFQLMGLPVEIQYDDTTGSESVEIPDGRTLVKTGEKDFVEYFYCDGYAFKIYEDEAGNVYEEFKQACPWSSGPMLFLGIRKVDTGEIALKWPENEIEENAEGIPDCGDLDLDDYSLGEYE